MDILFNIKQFLENSTLLNYLKTSSIIERHICVVLMCDKDLHVKVFTNYNIDIYCVKFSADLKDHFAKIINAVNDVTLLLAIFKPYFNYTTIELDKSQLQVFDSLNKDNFLQLLKIYYKQILFNSKIYFASKISSKVFYSVFKNYFDVSLNQIMVYDGCPEYLKEEVKSKVYLFTNKQKSFTKSSLVIMLEINGNTITLIDEANLHSFFNEFITVLEREFNIQITKSEDIQSCFLNYNIKKPFKRIRFDNHQMFFIIYKIKFKTKKLRIDKKKKASVFQRILSNSINHISDYKRRFGCELFDSEKEYKNRLLYEKESIRISSLILDIEKEINLNYSYLREEKDSMNNILNDEDKDIAKNKLIKRIYLNLLDID